MRLSSDEFDGLVREALAGVPDEFAAYLADVMVDVEARPDRKTAREMELDDPRELLGLYVGTPMTERSVETLVRFPDRIVIYRENILAVCETREEIIEEVRTTVLHELGHHFGLDEDDLDELGYG